MLGSRCASSLVVSALLCATTAAADDIDLTLYRDGDTYLQPTIRLDSAFFAERNAWFSKSRENAGDHVGYWGEFGVMPGLEGAYSLGENGTLRGRVSGVWTTTQFGLDAAGSNLDDRHPSHVTLEDLYVGWSSGDLFPALGKDAIDLSFGSQKYQVGSGFLFWDGASDGGSRGGFWLGMRKAFQLAAIARLKTGPFMGELVYLQPNDNPHSGTKVTGVNLEWTFNENAKLGGGYWFFADSEDFRRDGLDVFDLRGAFHPLPCLPGLVLNGEGVYERNGSFNESWAGYAELGYGFDELGWKPFVSYRYAGFSGDRGGDSQIEGFDPIYYGLSDWSTWYIGELFGGFMATNRNLDVQTVRGRIAPAEGWTVNLIYSYFRLDEFATELQPREFDPRIVNITDKTLGHEVDLTVDWAMNDHVLWSAVLGTLFPSDGLQQATGGNSVWVHAMLYASLSF